MAITLSYVPPPVLMVTASSAVTEPPQHDGRFWVNETQTLSDGSKQTFHYLADPGTDINAVASARGEAITAQLAAQAGAVPSSVTAPQARSAIYAEGLQPTVEAVVAQSPQAIQQLWYTAAIINRDDPNLIALATAIGLSSAQIDTLFQEAATYPE